MNSLEFEALRAEGSYPDTITRVPDADAHYSEAERLFQDGEVLAGEDEERKGNEVIAFLTPRSRRYYPPRLRALHAWWVATDQGHTFRFFRFSSCAVLADEAEAYAAEFARREREAQSLCPY